MNRRDAGKKVENKTHSMPDVFANTTLEKPHNT
jgi:hypothetical protein